MKPFYKIAAIKLEMVQKNNEINKKNPIKLQYEEIVTKLNALTHKMRQRGCDKCISIYINGQYIKFCMNVTGGKWFYRRLWKGFFTVRTGKNLGIVFHKSWSSYIT